MDCRHQGFYSVGSSYDRERKLLTFFSYCDECGTRLAEVAQLTSAALRVDARRAEDVESHDQTAAQSPKEAGIRNPTT